MSTDLSIFTPGEQNLSLGERSLSVVGGLALAAAAAQPRPNMFLNIAALAVGSYLAYRGATGYCPIKAQLGHSGGTDLTAVNT